MGKKPVGKIAHFFDKIGVAVIELTGNLKVGETIEIGKDEENAFQQVVSSMQIDHNPVEKAKSGEAIGMKVDNPVKEGDAVSKITED